MQSAQNDSLSAGLPGPDVWALGPRSSVSTLWWLLVLTFIAQLSLVLFILRKCVLFDRTLLGKLRDPKALDDQQPASYLSDQADIMIRRAESRSHPSGAQPSTALLSPALSESRCSYEIEPLYHYPCNTFMPGQSIAWDIVHC